MRIYTYSNYVINNLLVNMKYNYICKWPTVSFKAGTLCAVVFFLFFFSLFGEAVCFPPSLPNNLFCSASCIHWQMFPALGIYRVKGNRCKSLKCLLQEAATTQKRKRGRKHHSSENIYLLFRKSEYLWFPVSTSHFSLKGCRSRIWRFRSYIWDHCRNRCYFKCITPVK